MTSRGRISRSRFAVPFLLTVVGLAVLVVGIGSRDRLPPNARTLPLTLAFSASFLDPGVQRMRDLGPAVEVGPSAESGGVVPVRIWNVTSLVRFERDETGALKTLGIVPLSRDPDSDAWAVWRHRHGYGFIPRAGYFWNTIDRDRVSMPRARGELYDAFLKSVWSYWTIIGLETQRLKGGTPPVEPAPTLVKPVTAVIGDGGLVRPLVVDFQINPWRTPLRVRFEITPSTSVFSGEMRTFSWDFDMNAWRERHGYRKGLFTGYEWSAGFPAPFALDEDSGLLLDELLERAMALWSEVAVEQFFADYESKFHAAMKPPA